MSTDDHAPDRLQPQHLNMTAIVGAAVGCLLFLCLAIAGLHAVYRADVPRVPAAAPREFPEPRLRTDESAQLDQLLAEQQRHLTGYHWIDRPNGIVAVPIERAMQLIARRGGDAYKPVASQPTAGNGAKP